MEDKVELSEQEAKIEEMLNSFDEFFFHDTPKEILRNSPINEIYNCVVIPKPKTRIEFSVRGKSYNDTKAYEEVRRNLISGVLEVGGTHGAEYELLVRGNTVYARAIPVFLLKSCCSGAC